MATHSSILAWESPWTGRLEGYSPGGIKEPDMTEHTHTLPDLGILAKLGNSLVFMVRNKENNHRVRQHLEEAHYLCSRLKIIKSGDDDGGVDDDIYC